MNNGNVTLGGERLGAGNNQKVETAHYNRSTHDMSHVLRTSMASGTLVPFMTEVGLPGDTFDITLDFDGKTLPTVGPLFGSYKVQLDMFLVPIRLYQSALHMNTLNVGRRMQNVKLPQIELKGNRPNASRGSIDNQQINPSSIFSYLNIRGIGCTNGVIEAKREFNAIPYIAYWDIFKNYYANKQEDNAYVIHNDLVEISGEILQADIRSWTNPVQVYTLQSTDPTSAGTARTLNRASTTMVIQLDGITEEFDIDRISIKINDLLMDARDVFETWVFDLDNNILTGSGFRIGSYDEITLRIGYYSVNLEPQEAEDLEPKLKAFPLDNIDRMRKDLMKHDEEEPFVIKEAGDYDYEPYNLPLNNLVLESGRVVYSATSNQEGLAVKTYQSDLFNNWINTEWLDGENGVNEISKITIGADGSFSIDELNLSKKVYEMLNQIALSGGTYEDWSEVNYNTKANRKAISPMYLGGLSRELTFQEVISNAESTEQPLGTLAGRGIMTQKRKGGKVSVRVDEHSYIMGIVSLTPRIDYSQGNKWDTNLKTMDDFHKPALDGIGFQELITDQMAWFDTRVTGQGDVEFKSAGKQPAWINYTTNVNQVKGNFADQNSQMFMVLNRRYEEEYEGEGTAQRTKIKDLTTYIDPVKFNHVFAETRRDAQNFWVQIRTDMEVRRVMSHRQIPNL